MNGLGFFISIKDMTPLIQYILSLNVDLYRYNGEPFYLNNRVLEKERLSLCVFCHGDQPIVHKGSEGYYWVDQESDCIWFSVNSDFLIPGGISCESNVPRVQALYRRIVRYIQKEFIRTYDKSCYLGPDLYQAWKSYSVFFPFYVDANVFEIPHVQFKFIDFVREINKNGLFFIESDGRHHREIRAPLDDQAEQYLIFYSGAKLRPHFSSIIRESDLMYVPTEKKGELQVTVSSDAMQDLLGRNGESHIIYDIEDDVSQWMPKDHTLRDFSYFPESEAIAMVHRKTIKKDTWQFIIDSRYLENARMQKMWELVHSILHSCAIN